MKTNIDLFKSRYNTKEDGETVLKHAELGSFRDSLMGTVLDSEQLKQLGITKEMSRKEILDKLRITSRETEAIAWKHRHSIQLVIDFCATPIMQTNEFYEEKKPKGSLKEIVDDITNKIDRHVAEPIFDAIGRKIHTGSFFRKPKK